jgi:hypothetical protein
MPEMKDRLHEFVKAARTLLDHAEEALRHYESGNVQGACDVVSLSAYPMSHLGKEWKGILDSFGADGILPGGNREA